jgi:hypothetical protein
LKAAKYAVVPSPVDLHSWKEKIEADFSRDEPIPLEEVRIEEGDSSFQAHEEFKEGVLTIGCCGMYVFLMC